MTFRFTLFTPEEYKIMTTKTVGIDVHKSTSQIAVVDDEGTVMDERKVPNDQLHEVAEEYAGAETAIEATSNYYTIYDTLKEHLDVTLVDPLRTRWIAESSKKTDAIDAKKLANLLRVGMVAESYVPPPEIRERRALVRGRKKFVEQRTHVKNEIHALLDQHGITYDGSLWDQDGLEFLRDLDIDDPGRLLLDQWLSLLAELTERIYELDREVERVAAEVPEVELLMTIPGVSSYSGLLIHAEIGEIDRFDRAEEVVSYAGLDPVVEESGDTRTEGGISKRGNGYLRHILVMSATTAVHNAQDPYLSDFYRRLRDQRGKPHKVAIVATARKMLVSIFHMLQNEEPYDPPGVDT